MTITIPEFLIKYLMVFFAIAATVAVTGGIAYLLAWGIKKWIQSRGLYWAFMAYVTLLKKDIRIRDLLYDAVYRVVIEWISGSEARCECVEEWIKREREKLPKEESAQEQHIAQKAFEAGRGFGKGEKS